MTVSRVQNHGMCLLALKGGPGRLQRLQVSEIDQERILAVQGVEEVTYHALSRSIVVIYDRGVLEPNQLCACFGRLFPSTLDRPRKLEIQEAGQDGAANHAMEWVLNKLDGRFRDQLDRCRNVARIVPVGAAIQPVKLYFRRVLAPTWLDLIWQLIVL